MSSVAVFVNLLQGWIVRAILARKSDVSFLLAMSSVLDRVSSDETFSQDFSIDPNMKISDLLFLCLFDLFCEILQTTVLLFPCRYTRIL